MGPLTYIIEMHLEANTLCLLNSDMLRVVQGRSVMTWPSTSVPHSTYQAKVISVTGSHNLRNTYNKGPRAGLNSSSCDLWKDILSMTYKEAFLIKVRWLPSHIKESDQIPHVVSTFDTEANDIPNQFAAPAACKV